MATVQQFTHLACTGYMNAMDVINMTHLFIFFHERL